MKGAHYYWNTSKTQKGYSTAVYGLWNETFTKCLSRTKLRSKGEIQAQCSALNQVSLCLILLTGGQGAGGAGPGAAPPPRRDNGPLSPDCTETKDWFKYCLRIGQGGRAGPRPAAKTKPGRKSGCHIDLAWAGLGWAGWAGLGEGAASRGCWRAAAGQATTHPLPAPARPGPTLQPPPDITSFQCVHGTADCLPGPAVMQSWNTFCAGKKFQFVLLRGFPQSGVNGTSDKRKAGSLTLGVPYSAFAPIVEGLL